MSSIFSTTKYYLVNHPTIENFSWIPGETVGSTIPFLLIGVFAYLFLTWALSRRPLPPMPRPLIRSITAIYNTILLMLSFIMAIGGILSTISHAPDLHWIICMPPHAPPTGPIFFWAYIFYLSKFVEFMDTLLIILNKAIRRLTWLHVGHHSAVVIMCYMWMQTSQSLFPAVLVTNASVHVLMYAYYLSCSLGVRPSWRRLVTDCQILQFKASFFVLVVMLYYHITGAGCSGAWGWIFNAVFYAWLWALFADFHARNYG